MTNKTEQILMKIVKRVLHIAIDIYLIPEKIVWKREAEAMKHDRMTGKEYLEWLEENKRH